MTAPWGDERDAVGEPARDHDVPEPESPESAQGAGRASGAESAEGELEVGQRPGAVRTGLDPVDRVLARTDEVSRLPVTERAAAYEGLHRELEGILSEEPGKLPHGLVESGASTQPGSDGAGGGQAVPHDSGTPDEWLQR